MMNVISRKVASWSLVFSLASVMLLAACSGGGGGSGTSPQSSPTPAASNNDSKPAQNETPAPRPKVSIMTWFWGEVPPDTKGEVLTKIQDLVNVELDIQWVSENNYSDVLNVTIASGDMKDMILIPDPFSSVFRQAVDQGAFWDITDFYKDYKNLSDGVRIPPSAWELTKMRDGRNYGIPRPRPSKDAGYLYVRKDWLDQLGLPLPTTTEQLYETWKAFVEYDPQGNGDTVGFMGGLNPDHMGNFRPIMGLFTGANYNWKLEGDQLVYADLLPGTREGLQFLANAYKDKLLIPDLASLTNTQLEEYYHAGKAGMMFAKGGSIPVYTANLPGVEINDINAFYPLGPINNFAMLLPGFAGMYAIPKSVPEEHVREVLSMIDKWMEDEPFTIAKWGIEGTHYDVVDGKKVRSQAQSDQFNKENLGILLQIVLRLEQSTYTGSDLPADVIAKLEEAEAVLAKVAVPDYSVGLYSETFQTYGAEIAKRTQDLKTKIILGVEPIEAWDTYVEQLKNDANMQKIIAEINESYKARVAGK